MRWSGFMSLLALVAAVAGAAWLAARHDALPRHYNPLAPLDLAQPPGLVMDAKLWLIAGDAGACRAALARSGVIVEAMPARREGNACALDGTVVVERLSTARIEPEEMRCDVALRLALLDRPVVQPLARRHFGVGASDILHFGSYSCRTIAGSSRMSEHASANAFDISGVRLADGREIALARHWQAGDAQARFLRDVRDGACGLFNMVLSPDYNAAHPDHLHVDMGWGRCCN